ncbi:MAG: hypothetical protein EOO07_21730 [Chitinophagaceae bacterium]|nr:MAG: hypothetical protein EOO07_21730 [Chitinophagaceae bacterium]
MEQELEHYEFINSQTGNVISYMSYPAGMDKKEVIMQLEKQRAALAIANQLYIELIYWQEHDHCIR